MEVVYDVVGPRRIAEYLVIGPINKTILNIAPATAQAYHQNFPLQTRN